MKMCIRDSREIESIQEVTGGQFEKSFAITPFSAQEKHLRMRLDCTEDVCGTIHAFQGKEEETVYFSTVLNDLDFANRHLEGGHCMFNKELINVAVSRSKKKFVLVSDKNYLRKKNQDLCDLINYIETYGKEIPDKSVCIFDDLYKMCIRDSWLPSLPFMQAGARAGYFRNGCVRCARP